MATASQPGINAGVAASGTDVPRIRWVGKRNYTPDPSTVKFFRGGLFVTR
jgi:hypothetical protein